MSWVVTAANAERYNGPDEVEAVGVAKAAAQKFGSAMLEGPPSNGVPIRVQITPMPEGGFDITERPPGYNG